jgi:hypothetical protein
MTPLHPISSEEARLRARLQGHEFDYRPDAWKDLEQRLHTKADVPAEGQHLTDATDDLATPMATPMLVGGLWLSLGFALIISMLALRAPNAPAVQPAVTPPVLDVEMPSVTSPAPIAQHNMTPSVLNVEIPSATPPAPVAQHDVTSPVLDVEMPSATSPAPVAQHNVASPVLDVEMPSATPLAPVAQHTERQTIANNSTPQLLNPSTNNSTDPTTDFPSLETLKVAPNPTNATVSNTEAQRQSDVIAHPATMNSTTLTTSTNPEVAMLPALAISTPQSLNYSTQIQLLNSTTITQLLNPNSTNSTASTNSTISTLPKWTYGGTLSGLWTLLDADGIGNTIRIRPQFGVFAAKRIGARTRLMAELQYKKVKGYDLSATQTRFAKDFRANNSGGLLANNFAIQVVSTHVIQMPITLRQQLSGFPKWAFIGGLRPALIVPRGNVSLADSYEFAVPTGNSGAGYDSTIEQIAGQYDSTPPRAHDVIRRFDIGAVLGLEWNFYRRWSLDLCYNQGLLDLTPDAYYNSSLDHTNSDLQLSLRYSFGD